LPPVNPPGSSLADYVTYTGATQNVDLGEFGVDAGFVTLDTTPTNTPTAQGTIFWDADDNTVDVVLNGYIMKIGEDLFYPVKNQTGSNIPKGRAVRFAGTIGASGRLLVAPFIADGSVPSTFFMGVTAEAIADGEDGKVLYFGRIRGMNTLGFEEGDVLYASTTTAGEFQTAVPVAPNNIVQVAAVINKSITQGVIFVRPSFGSNINQDEGVKIVSPTTGQLLQLQSNGLWENKTKAQVLGGTSSQFVKGDGTLDSNTYQVTSEKGQPNGYASLDSNGKVPLAQINDALIGNVNFQGLWNAATNTPTLANPPASGTKGYYYIVSTAGTFAGISFEVGDWIISSGSAWQKIDNTDAVSSVFGRTGNVVASNGDYTTAQVTESGNLYYTDGRARGALSFVAGSGAYNSSTGVITIPTNNNQITNGAGYITSAALSGYLPLTGGTLTGPLGGTSASFSESIKVRGGSNLGGYYFDYQSDASSRSFRISSEHLVFADFVIQRSTTRTGTTYENLLYFDVNRAATFSSSVTANSFIRSAGTSSQFLKADGSIDSNTYVTGGPFLPLAGGTLTGALNGTSASFTGNVGIGTAATISGADSLLLLTNTSTNGKSWRVESSSIGTLFFTQVGVVNALQLAASTGAATFSSSVTATQMLINTTASNFTPFLLNSNGSFTASGNITTGLAITNTTAGRSINIGVFDAGAYAYIQSAYVASAQTTFALALNPNGGNVGIGTTSPEGKLTVVGISAQPPTSGTTANSLLQLKGSLGNELNIGSNTVAGNYGAYIQASDNNLAVPYQLNLQPTGGNVIIGGYTDAGFKLDVNGTGRFSDALNGTSASFSTKVNVRGGSNLGGYYFDYQSDASSRSFRISSEHLAFADFVIQRSTTRTGTTYENLLYFDANRAATFVSSVTATSFFESSDATIKTLVEDAYQAKGIDSVVAKLYIKNGKQELGYYAQDLEAVLPSAVSKGSNGLLNLSYREVHTAKIAYLEQRIKQLENELLKPS
jgi:hypothetical protein